MRSSQSVLASPCRWLWVATIAVGASAAIAQEPATTTDDTNATMRIIIDPNADTPDDIIRKIAAARPKRSAKSTDALAKDLASPGNEEPDEAGTPDPTTPTPVAPEPHGNGPGAGGGPDVGGAPDPRDHVGGLGHQTSDDARNHSEDARRHHDKPPKPKPHDKPPHNPGSHPPATPPPATPPRNPGRPDHKPPGHQPPGHRPPGPPPPAPHPPKPG